MPSFPKDEYNDLHDVAQQHDDEKNNKQWAPLISAGWVINSHFDEAEGRVNLGNKKLFRGHPCL